METQEEYKTIYQRAIIKFGVDNQIKKLQQELTELLLALSYREEGRADHNVEEEFADVEIVMQQIRPLFNQNKEIDQWKDIKLERLVKRVG